MTGTPGPVILSADTEPISRNSQHSHIDDKRKKRSSKQFWFVASGDQTNNHPYRKWMLYLLDTAASLYVYVYEKKYADIWAHD